MERILNKNVSHWFAALNNSGQARLCLLLVTHADPKVLHLTTS